MNQKARGNLGELWHTTSGNRSPLGKADPRGFEVYHSMSSPTAVKKRIPRMEIDSVRWDDLIQSRRELSHVKAHNVQIGWSRRC